MNKKKKNQSSFIGVGDKGKASLITPKVHSEAGISISPEIHKKAERIAKALMNTPSRGLKSKKVN